MAGAIKNSKVPIKISNIAAVSFVHQLTDFERRNAEGVYILIGSKVMTQDTNISLSVFFNFVKNLLFV